MMVVMMVMMMMVMLMLVIMTSCLLSRAANYKRDPRTLRRLPQPNITAPSPRIAMHKITNS